MNIKSLQEYLMEAIAGSRFKVSPVVNKIIKKSAIKSICDEVKTKLESFGFEDIFIEPERKWEVADIEESEPNAGRYIILYLNTLTNNSSYGNEVDDYYMAEYGCDAIQQFDKEYGTKESGRFGMYDAVDVTEKFGGLPEHVRIYAQNHLGSSRGTKHNHPNFTLAIPVSEIQELWDKFND